MTAPEPKTGGGFTPADWASIISGAGQGASSAFGSMAQNAGSRMESRAQKKKTLADLYNNQLKRQMGLYRANMQYMDDTSDFQSQALQGIARGFVEALKGSGRRG